MKIKENEDYAELAGMSDIHKAALERAGQSWQEANAKGDQKGMDSAHAAAESIRGLYGYSGGEDGSQYVPTQTVPKATSKSTPSYINQYQGAINQAANALMNREAFTYDHNTDPMYQQYADSYTRQGQQAMQDTLAQVSARTGGLASSYAGTAAQQTYNGYMSALADKVPELRQLAYQMYMDEGDTMRQNLQMLQGLENTAYGRYRDGVADSQWQQTFDYNVAQDALAQNNYLAEIAYQKERDKLADERYQTEWNYGVERDQLSDERYDKEYSDNMDMAAAQLLAQAGNFSGYKSALNLTDEQVADLGKWYQEQNAPKVTTSGGGGNKYTKAQAEAAVASALAGHTEDPHVRSIIEGYFGMPMEAYLAGQTPEEGGANFDHALKYVQDNLAADPKAAFEYLARMATPGEDGKSYITSKEADMIFEVILGYTEEDLEEEPKKDWWPFW